VRTTYYFKTRFGVRDSQVLLALYPIDGICQRRALSYTSTMWRYCGPDMPRGRINSTTRALTYLQQGRPWTVHVPSRSLTGSRRLRRPSLVEGTNYVGVGVHMSSGNARVAFDLRVSAVRSAFCKGRRRRRPDVCDGLDNNRDGLVDRDPKTEEGPHAAVQDLQRRSAEMCPRAYV